MYLYCIAFCAVFIVIYHPKSGVFNVNHQGTVNDCWNLNKIHVYIYEVHQGNRFCCPAQNAQTAKHCSHDWALSAGGLVTGALIPPELLCEIHENQGINKMQQFLCICRDLLLWGRRQWIAVMRCWCNCCSDHRIWGSGNVLNTRRSWWRDSLADSDCAMEWTIRSSVPAKGKRIISSSETCRPDVGPTQLSIQG